MRFPSMVKLGKVTIFDKFNLLGIGAVIKVSKWSHGNHTIGKLNTFWVRFGEVLDCLRQFLVMCELETTFGSSAKNLIW